MIDKIMTKLVELLIGKPTPRPAYQLPPHLAALTRIQRSFLECFYGRFHPDSPEIRAITSNFCGYFENEYADMERMSDQFYRQYVEAALLTCGRTELLDAVLEALPDKPTGRPTGSCIVISSTALSYVLPLPKNLQCGGRYHGRKEEIRSWLTENRDKLNWNSASGQFDLTI